MASAYSEANLKKKVYSDMRMIIVGGVYFRIKFSLFHKNYNSATDMLVDYLT